MFMPRSHDPGVAGDTPPIGPMIKMHYEENTTFFALYFWSSFYCNMDS